MLTGIQFNCDVKINISWSTLMFRVWSIVLVKYMPECFSNYICSCQFEFRRYSGIFFMTINFKTFDFFWIIFKIWENYMILISFFLSLFIFQMIWIETNILFTFVFSSHSQFSLCLARWHGKISYEFSYLFTENCKFARTQK